ncbi:MAG: DUF748 domain-containing protein [Candidatus Accumulibacter sp.]|jgi:uncharacterized protein involved in outer membrane biogenesis|nr:DUF748 domain-containing protein [Accumulibacter sp.]
MSRRWPIFLALAAAVALAGGAAWHQAAGALRTRIARALGPRGEAREINVGLGGVDILGLRIRAPENAAWPEEDELRARRVRIEPDIFELLVARLSIESIRIEGAYVVVSRARDGKTRVVPSLFDPPPEPPPPDARAEEAQKESAGKTAIDIGRIVVSDGVVEFHDASIRATPVRLRVEQIEATVGRPRLPEARGHTSLKLDGIVKGRRQDGKLSIDGSFDPAAGESRLTTKLRDVDMTALQPYLIKAAEIGVERGSLDLDLKSSVANGKLRAPGTLTLSGLGLTPGTATFMGLPRETALNLLKDRKGRISMKFTLEGDIGDPRFSLNEQMAVRLGSSLAGTLGVSLESLVKGVDRGAGGANGPAQAIGKSVGKLLGKQRKGRR